MKPTIYIAGPMRGKPDFNRAAFNAAAERLADKGWHPINPVDIERIYPCVSRIGSTDTRRLLGLMEIELEFVKRADAIYLLDGWGMSNGAMAEMRAFMDKNPTGIYPESEGIPYADGRYH